MPPTLPCSSSPKSDRADDLFPGPGLEIPSSDERDRADAVVGYAIPRQRYGTMAYFANAATKRALLRTHVRRHFARSSALFTPSFGG